MSGGCRSRTHNHHYSQSKIVLFTLYVKVIESGLPMQGRLIHGRDGSLTAIPYGQKGQVGDENGGEVPLNVVVCPVRSFYRLIDESSMSICCRVRNSMHA